MTSKDFSNVDEAGSSDGSQSLAIKYAELLRLRRKVLDAEALNTPVQSQAKSSRAQKDRVVFGRSR